MPGDDHRATTYPAYPNPSRPTGWANIPAVILAADLTGREDIEYTAMCNSAIIPVDNATLAISEPIDGTRIWLLGLQFDNGLADLDLVSLADPETVTMFAQVELLLVTTEARMNNAVDNHAAALILVSNDPKRWADTMSNFLGLHITGYERPEREHRAAHSGQTSVLLMGGLEDAGRRVEPAARS